MYDSRMTTDESSPRLADGPPRRDPVRGKSRFAIDCPYELHLPRRPAPKKKWPLLVALHGISQRASMFAETIDPLITEHRAVLVPDGPYAHEVLENELRREGRAWYIFTGDQDAFKKSARQTAKHVWALVEKVAREYPIDRDRVSILGWSQGGYLAGMMALDGRFPLIAACLVASRLKDELLVDRKASDLPVPPIYCAHGERDKLVPLEYALAAAKRAMDRGVDVAFETFPSGHRIIPEELAAIDRWLSTKEPKKLRSGTMKMKLRSGGS